MSDSPHIHSVSELNQQVRTLLLEHFSKVTVEGEISNMMRHRSGHWYFTLKDTDSEIRCAMFRSNNLSVDFTPDTGDAIQVCGRVDLYVQRGSYQLVVESMQQQGRGDLLQQMQALKIRLTREGLFEPERKQVLPFCPDTLGVITSASGAALRDVVRVLRRRWPVAQLYVYPATVQGPQAAESLIEALKLAAQHQRCEVLILTRGGGSLEDLLAFSDEAVVRAVADCPIPIITGIGHETDTSLADFAADQHAATPTAAAEQASEDGPALHQQTGRLLTRCIRATRRALMQAQRTWDAQRHRLTQVHPARQIQMYQQRLDDLFDHLQGATTRTTEQQRHQLSLAEHRLLACSPESRIEALQRHRTQIGWQLGAAIQKIQQRLHLRLEQTNGTLHAVSPQRTLERGYAIALRQTPQGLEIMRQAKQAQKGEAFDLKLADGTIGAEVIRIASPDK